MKFRKKTTATLLIAIFMISTLAVAIPVGATLPVIQDLINAAESGATVVIPEGEYTEDLVISQPLTLQGSGKTLTIVTGTLRIAASDVNVDGFKIIGTETESNEGAVSIDDTLGLISGVTISNNYITGTSVGIRGEQEGHGVEHVTIENNEVKDNTGKAILFYSKIKLNVRYITITGNEIIGNGGSGISFYGVGPNTITNNLVTLNIGNGISIKYDDGDYVGGNIVVDNQDMGINIHECTNAVIEYNDISLHQNPMVITYFWGSVPVEVSKGAGIYVHEASVDNTIQFNDVHHNNIGVLVSKEQTDFPTWTYINDNNIADNVFFGVVAHTSVDATANWWGAPDKSGVLEELSGIIFYDPWRNAPYPEGDLVYEGTTTVWAPLVYPKVSISVSPESVAFPEVTVGGWSQEADFPVTVTHTGSPEITEEITWNIIDDTDGFYVTYLEYSETQEFVLDPTTFRSIVLTLENVPLTVEPGEYKGTLVFWAEYKDEFIP